MFGSLASFQNDGSLFHLLWSNPTLGSSKVKCLPLSLGPILQMLTPRSRNDLTTRAPLLQAGYAKDVMRLSTQTVELGSPMVRDPPMLIR